MSWLKIDDHFPDHPKMLRLNSDYDCCLALHIRALCYCAANLTDGFVPLRFGGEPRLVKRLVEVGLWMPCEGGHTINDYLQYNPSREKVLAERAAGNARVQKYRNGGCNGDSNDVTNGDCTTPPVPVPVTPNKTPSSNSASTHDASFDAFWSVYPRRVGKKAARSKWDVAIKTTDPQVIIDAAKAYQFDTREGGQFIPHPTTWLNQGRWDDEFTPAVDPTIAEWDIP
jgi:hypothetical protein